MTIKPVTLFLSKNKNILVSIIIFIISFLIYSITLLPAVGTGDVAKFQFITYNMGIPHTTGYPLYIIIAKIWSFLPVGTLAYRINLLSAFFASLAGVVIYLINMKITKNLFAGFISSLIFCFSLTLWSQAVIAEVYTLNIFFIALIVLLLLNFSETQKNIYAYGAFITFALALGNHFLVITAFPAIIAGILFADKKFFKSIKNIIYIILPFIATLALYSFLFIRAKSHPIYNEGNIDSISSFMWYLTGGIFKGQFFKFGGTGLFSRFIMFLNILFNQFTLPVLILGTIGFFLMAVKKTRIFIMLFSIIIVNMIIIINYSIFDIDVYIIPTALISSIFSCYSIYFLLESITKAISRLNRRHFKFLKSAIPVAMIIFTALSFYNIGYNFRINDRSKELAHYTRSRNIATKVENNAVIIPEDYFVSMSLLYYIWVEYEENSIMVPFSFIANPYYIDLEYLESQLGIKREPFRITLEQINAYKEENNIFIEDIAKIVQRRPVYILQKNPAIDSKFNLKEITRQKFDFSGILANIPEQNNAIILLKDPDDAKIIKLADSLDAAGFEINLQDMDSIKYRNLAVITDKRNVAGFAGLEKNKIYELDLLLNNYGISSNSGISFSIDDDFSLKTGGTDKKIDSSIIILNIDNNFSKTDIYEFSSFEDYFEIPYSYSNPQIFKVLSLKE